MSKAVEKLVEQLRPIVSGVTFIVTMILIYFIVPLTEDVDANTEAVNALKTKIAVQEVMIIGMNTKLDDIKGDLEKILDMIHDGH